MANGVPCMLNLLSNYKGNKYNPNILVIGIGYYVTNYPQKHWIDN